MQSDFSDIPTVTVLMPVYNGERFLEEQIQSILDQTGVRLTLVVANDGSTDNSLGLLLCLAAKDTRITVLNSDINLGLMATLARLLREVQGQFFALADQDDIWDSNKIIASVKSLKETGAQLVYSDVRLIDADGNLTASTYLEPMGLRPQTGRDPLPFVFRNPAIGHTIVARTEVAIEAAEIPLYLVFHEAWIVGCACLLGAVAFINQPLGSYRQHNGNVIGARKSVAHRLVRLFGPNGTIERRQKTRILAIGALASRYPDLLPIAFLYRRSGFARLLGLPRFTLFMLRLAPQIGIGAVMAEVALFSFTSKTMAAEIRRAGQPPLPDARGMRNGF